MTTAVVEARFSGDLLESMPTALVSSSSPDGPSCIRNSQGSISWIGRSESKGKRSSCCYRSVSGGKRMSAIAQLFHPSATRTWDGAWSSTA